MGLSSGFYQAFIRLLKGFEKRLLSGFEKALRRGFYLALIRLFIKLLWAFVKL
jgi:hypothetical protein